MTAGHRDLGDWPREHFFPAIFSGISDIRQLLPRSVRPQLLKNRVFWGFVAWHALCSAPEVFPEFTMSISFGSSVFSPTFLSTPTSSASQSASASLTTKPTNSAVQQFLEFANMTPAQRLHAEMLSELGLTEDQYKAMSPADQQKVDDKIRDLVKKQADETNNKRAGLITDISA